MMTHHFVMTSSLLIKILKIDKFGDFSCDIDYNSRTEASKRSALVYIYIYSRTRLARTLPGSGKSTYYP